MEVTPTPGVGGGQIRYCCCLLAGQASPAQENIKIALFVVNFGTIIYKYIYLGWLIGFIRLTATSGVGRGRGKARFEVFFILFYNLYPLLLTYYNNHIFFYPDPDNL